jgi:hypothetical protein
VSDFELIVETLVECGVVDQRYAEVLADNIVAGLVAADRLRPDYTAEQFRDELLTGLSLGEIGRRRGIAWPDLYYLTLRHHEVFTELTDHRVLRRARDDG